MKNFVQEGKGIKLACPRVVRSGQPVVFASGLVGIALVDGVQGQEITFRFDDGVYTLDKADKSVAITQYSRVVCDATGGVGPAPTGALPAGSAVLGIALEASAAGSPTVLVRQIVGMA